MVEERPEPFGDLPGTIAEGRIRHPLQAASNSREGTQGGDGGPGNGEKCQDVREILRHPAEFTRVIRDLARHPHMHGPRIVALGVLVVSIL